MPEWMNKPTEGAGNGTRLATDTPKSPEQKTLAQLAYKNGAKGVRKEGEADPQRGRDEHQAGVPIS